MKNGKSKHIQIRKKVVPYFERHQILTARQLNKLVDQINKLNGYDRQTEKL